jgi:nucleotide-binding universal stress UspA family protein
MQFKNILVNTTPRVERDPAIIAAMKIAKRHAAAVTVFDVAPDLTWPVQFLTSGWEQTIEDICGSKKTVLENRAKWLAAEGIPAELRLAEGRLSVAIVRQVVSAHHDLVIKVAEPSGANRSGFLGSTDFRLLRKCPCPILILKHDDAARFQRVAVALDVMDEHEIQRCLDDRVSQAAAALCEGDLEFVYAMRSVREIIQVDPEDANLITSDRIASWQQELNQSARERLAAEQARHNRARSEYHLLLGTPAEAIPEFVNSHGIDLLVLGTLARSGLDGLLIGNTAESILNNVHCAVLALKPETFVSPLAGSDSSRFAA